MSTTPPIEPLVTDQHIKSYWDKEDQEWAANPDLYDGMDKVDIAESCTTDGMKHIRDIYEAERAELIGQRDEAVKHLRELTEHWSAEDGAIYPFAEDVENAVNFLSTIPSPPNR